MKKRLVLCANTVMALVLATAPACSTLRGEKKGSDLAASGPVVIDTRVQPSTIELDRQLKPLQRAEVVTEVKDFQAEITDVRLRFMRLPLEVKLKHAGGTTWQAELSPSVIRKLAIGNQKTSYEANIIAKDSQGNIAMSKDPVQIVVKSPDLSKAAG